MYWLPMPARSIIRPATSDPTTPPICWLSVASDIPFRADSGPTMSYVYACLRVIMNAHTHPIPTLSAMMGHTGP